MVGLYSVIARTFPTQVRATGTGFVIGIGRLGSAVSPAIAGLLFAGGMGRDGVSMTMASAALLAALLLALFTVRAPTN
jgi:glycine/D-amino acid oxidase-like deaminating enzyme